MRRGHTTRRELGDRAGSGVAALVGAVVQTIPLSSFGLMTTAEVAAHHRRGEGTVTHWIGKGYLRAVPVGARCYLVRRSDCEGFAKPRPGRPRGKREAPPAAGTVPLSRFGLVTVRQFAERHRRAEQTVLRWAAEGRFIVVPVPGSAYLIRRSDGESFRPPKLGAPSWEDGARR